MENPNLLTELRDNHFEPKRQVTGQIMIISKIPMATSILYLYLLHLSPKKFREVAHWTCWNR